MAVRRLLGAALSAVSLALSGCGAGSPATGDEPLGTMIDLDQVDFPLAEFELTDAEFEITLRARYVLTQRCADGFQEKLPAWHSGRHRPSRNDRYGMYDERTARTWAYSLDGPPTTAPLWEDEIAKATRLFRVVNGVDEQGRPAGIDGLREGGCREAADRQLDPGKTTSGPGRATNPVPALESKAWKTSREDPAVRRAANEWHSCMSRRGHTYENPVEAPYSYWTSQRMTAHPNPTREQRENGIPPTEAERRAALDDIACKNESGFVRTWLAADLSAQRQLAEENHARLQSHRHRLDETLRNAAEVE